MKKIIAILLALVMVVGMTACNNEPAPTEPNVTVAPTDPVTEPVIEETDPATEPVIEETEPPVVAPELSTAWADYQFAIGDHVFTLPVAYTELKEATGYSIGEELESAILNAGCSTTVTMFDENNNYVFNMDLANTTDGDLTNAECVVTGVCQDALVPVSMSDPDATLAAHVYIANNLCLGAVTSKEALIEMFGEPNKVEEQRSGEETFGPNDVDTYIWAESEDNVYVDSLLVEMRLDTNEIRYIILNNWIFE